MLDFIKNASLISENQIGFKEKSRTSDHIFTIKTITDYYKNKKQKVYAAFIDLRKAFDTIWRVGLYYKLLKSNIHTNMFNIIFSMYENTKTKIKFASGLSKAFTSECGVKQGDILSPSLFNIFINGIVDELKAGNCDPVQIGEISVNCLLYADDIVLLSESKSGLQNCLNILETYCSNWKLQVNVEKSKVLIFNSNGKFCINEFTYNGSILQTVSKFCYLGLTLKCNGNLNLAMSVLVEKARKAYFKIKKTIGLDNSCKLLEKLFDSIITPVLLYCCEIWGICNNIDENSIIEKFHMKFIKEILGVHCKTTNAPCRADLGRQPLWTRIQFSSIKFWNHLITSKNTLAFKIYKTTVNTNSWTKNIFSIFNKLGFSFITKKENSIKSLLRSIKQRISDQCLQEESAKIYNSSKLKFYQVVFNNFKRCGYTDILKKKTDRSIISRLRLSAHNLAIEKGRHFSIPTDKRFCNICNTQEIEDEFHFLFSCHKYSNHRLTFERNLNSVHGKILNMSYTQKVKLCFNSHCPEVLKITNSFIKKCITSRNDCIT